MKNRFRWAVPLVFILLSGCAASARVVSEDPAKTALSDKDVVPEPGWVLDGTDMLPISEVRTVALPLSPAGNYRAETGGSDITVSISGAADGSWVVTRVYREPDLPPDTRRYQTKRSGRLLVSLRDGVTIQGTEDGMLMLELNSGVGFIPADFWIHYIHADKGG